MNKIPPARAVLRRIRQEFSHHVELVITGEDLPALFLAGLDVLFHNELSIVFEDVGQALAGEYLPPQIIGLEPMMIGGIACAVVPALVERQEPRVLALKVGAEPHLVFIQGKMGYAPPQFKELFPRVAVTPVLLHGVVYRLFGEAIL